ncbi:MAG: hypothetical protein WA161_03270 [Pseudomonas sp.]|uniref:hypothetical protein n=2 Tax=Pseudomonas sp. TaxID=306 RepID=UPI003BB5E344
MRALQGGCLSLWLLASSTLWAAAPAQQYQQLRSQATLLAVNALLYFDADPRLQPDARHLTSLREAQQRLDALAVELELPAAIGDALASLNAWLDDLQALRRDEAPRYPQLLIGLLDSRAQLDRQSNLAYQQVRADLDPVVRLLNRQSLDIASLLLHAQARSARVLGDHSLAYSEVEFTARDQAIEEGFTRLIALLPEQAAALHKQRLAYRFVRQRLLDRDPGRVTGSLERYLAGIVVALDELAAR